MQTLIDFVQDNWNKIIKYAGVSVIGVILGQTLLYLFFEQFGWNAAIANIAAVTLSTIPGYVLNRAWVWGKTGTHSVTAEVIPFWGMAFLGLVLSTVLVHFAEQRWDSWVLVNIANLAAFGSLWVAKFFVLDRVLFSTEPSSRVESAA